MFPEYRYSDYLIQEQCVPRLHQAKSSLCIYRIRLGNLLILCTGG